MSNQSKPSIVFAHGIWADGSCFQKLIPTLRAEGHEVMAAQCGLDTLNTEYRSRREGLSWSCVHCLSPHVCWALQVARPGHYPRAHSHCSFNRRQQEQPQ